MAALACWHFICSPQSQKGHWSWGPYLIVCGIALSLVKCIHFIVFYSRFKVSLEAQKYLSGSEIIQDLRFSSVASKKKKFQTGWTEEGMIR